MRLKSSHMLHMRICPCEGDCNLPACQRTESERSPAVKYMEAKKLHNVPTASKKNPGHMVTLIELHGNNGIIEDAPDQ